METQILDTEECDQYTRKLVEYTTESSERVQAFVLVPHGVTKAPGVLAIHQDGGRRPYEFGKSEPAGVGGDPELAYGLELCLRGYVVICPDRFPFESRSLANSEFRETFAQFPLFTRLDGKDFDLTEDLYAGCIANRLLFAGRTELGVTLFELMRAVDCLREQPEVDPSRIGVIGHSAGGYYGALLMYVDPRVKAGCASCGTFLIRWFFGEDRLRPINGIGAGAVVPGLKHWGDVDDILAGIAPRPFLETRGDLPGLPTSARSDLTTKAKARYVELGVPERFRYETYRGTHEFRKDKREKSYAWLDKWLRRAR